MCATLYEVAAAADVSAELVVDDGNRLLSSHQRDADGGKLVGGQSSQNDGDCEADSGHAGEVSPIVRIYHHLADAFADALDVDSGAWELDLQLVQGTY